MCGKRGDVGQVEEDEHNEDYYSCHEKEGYGEEGNEDNMKEKKEYKEKDRVLQGVWSGDLWEVEEEEHNEEEGGGLEKEGDGEEYNEDKKQYKEE